MAKPKPWWERLLDEVEEMLPTKIPDALRSKIATRAQAMAKLEKQRRMSWIVWALIAYAIYDESR